MTISRLLARPMLASMFVVGGVNAAAQRRGQLAPRAEPVTDKLVPLLERAVPDAPIPPTRSPWSGSTAPSRSSPALALATGRVPRALGGRCWPPSLVPTTAAGHRFWEESGPGRSRPTSGSTSSRTSRCSAACCSPPVDTEGKPGVAWRARRAAKDARREARHLAAHRPPRGQAGQGAARLTSR